MRWGSFLVFFTPRRAAVFQIEGLRIINNVSRDTGNVFLRVFLLISILFFIALKPLAQIPLSTSPHGPGVTLFY